MSKFKIAAAVMLAGFALLLSSCDMEMVIKVVDEKTVEPSMIMSMSKEEVTMLKSMSMGEDVSCEGMKKSMEEEDSGNKPSQVITLDAPDGGMKCEFKYDSSELSNIDSKNLTVENGVYTLKIPGDELKDVTKELNSGSSELGGTINIKFTVIMPGTITKATIGGKDVEFSGDTMSVPFDKLNGDLVVVSGKGTSSTLPIILGVAAVLVIVVIIVVVVVMASKRKKKAAGPMGMPMPGMPGAPGMPGQAAMPGNPVMPGQATMPTQQPPAAAPPQAPAQPNGFQPGPVPPVQMPGADGSGASAQTFHADGSSQPATPPPAEPNSENENPGTTPQP